MAARRRRHRRSVPRKPVEPKRPEPKVREPEGTEPQAVTPPVKTPPARATPKAPPVKTPPAKAAPPARRVGAHVAPKPVRSVETPPDDPYVGRTIGRCTIQERIGVGRTAVVYRAHYEALDDVVAIKLLTPEARAMPELVDRFHSEAKVIARLDNENVVKIYDVGSDGDDHFMVMELLDGFSVLDLIQREEQVDVMDALRIVRQAANGLVAAHAQGIIHRDIKPQNMLLLEDGTVKLLDFGLAARFDDRSERVGTPHYMAPEVCVDGNADLGTDIYALGIVLYHLLVGQPPYSGKGIKEILRLHVQGDPLRPERQRPTLPKDVAELVRTLTKKDPLARPNAAEVVALLDGIGGETVREKDTLRRKRSSRSRARVEARKRSATGPAIAAAAVVAALVIAVVAMAGSGNEDTEKPPPGPGSSTGPVAVTTDPIPATPAVESEADRLAREARERAEAEAQAKVDKEREARQKEEDAERALGSAESWAREHWKGPDETKPVIEKYQSVYNRYRGTEAGKTALARVKGIKDGSVHPHPDRSYSDAQSIAEARERWRAAKPEIEKLITAHNYGTAYSKLPERVNDADGQLSGELRFWDTVLTHLRKFQDRFVKYAASIDDGDRQIETPEGEGTVRGVERQSIQVAVKGGSMVKVGWDQLPPATILALARSAFVPQDDTELYVHMLAYAYAHRLQDPFWNLQLDLSGRADTAEWAALISELESRFDERLK